MKVRRTSAEGSSAEQGFTLLEVVVSVMILGLIMGALTAAFLTSMNVSASTSQRVRESNDAQLIAGYLVRDAQAAGGTDPMTGALNNSLGVATVANGVSYGCNGPGSLVIGFKWIDHSAAGVETSHVANYTYVVSDVTFQSRPYKAHWLVRTTCVNGGSVVPLTLATKVRQDPSPTVRCKDKLGNAINPCPTASLPDSVSLDVTESNDPVTSNPAPYTFTLTASLRSQAQATPTTLNSESAPLLLFGSGTCSGNTSPLNGQSSVPVTVYGTAVFTGGDLACNPVDMGNHYTALGGNVAVAPAVCTAAMAPCTQVPNSAYNDPFAALPRPAPPSPSDTCAADHHSPNGPGVYKSTLNVSNGQTLSPGIYFLCAGFSGSGGSANGALLYQVGICALGAPQPCSSATPGHYPSFNFGGTFTASPYTGGTYTGMVVWQDKTNNASLGTASANSNVHLNGTVYAPTATFEVKKGIAIRRLIAKELSYGAGHGTGSSQIGLVPPGVSSISPNVLTRGASSKVITINGSNFLNNPAPVVSFSSAGINQIGPTNFVNAGQIKVTVTVSTTATLGLSDVTITNNDQGTDTEEDAFTINPQPSVTTTSLPPGVRGATYSQTLTSTGGTGTIIWSLAGGTTLPTTLTLSAGGVISGTVSATATTKTFTVIATDSNGVASAGQSLTLTINAPPLSITTNACNVRRSTAMQGFALGASGGTPPYVWSAPGKPAWISLTAGTLTGTAPATTGALPFTLTVTDADSASASTTFTVTVTNNNPGNPRC